MPLSYQERESSSTQKSDKLGQVGNAKLCWLCCQFFESAKAPLSKNLAGWECKGLLSVEVHCHWTTSVNSLSEGMTFTTAVDLEKSESNGLVMPSISGSADSAQVGLNLSS